MTLSKAGLAFFLLVALATGVEVFEVPYHHWIAGGAGWAAAMLLLLGSFHAAQGPRREEP